MPPAHAVVEQRRNAILNVLRSTPMIDSGEIVKRVGMPATLIGSDLMSLLKQGRAARHFPANGDHNAKILWSVAEATGEVKEEKAEKIAELTKTRTLLPPPPLPAKPAKITYAKISPSTSKLPILPESFGDLYGNLASPLTLEVRIPPATAKRMLDMNTNNRNLNRTRVKRYADLMIAGQWKQNGDTIRVATGNVLLDGQHRLAACVASNTPLDTLVVFGLPADVMPTIDTGHSRSLRNVLTINKEVSQTALSTIIRWAWLIERMYTEGAGKETLIINSSNGPQHIESVQYLDLHRDTLTEAAKAAHHTRSVTRMIGPVLGVYAIALRTHPKEAHAFFDQVARGIGLKSNDPAYALRARLINERGSQRAVKGDVVAAWTVFAWNAFMQKRALSQVRWEPTAGFPRMK